MPSTRNTILALLTAAVGFLVLSSIEAGSRLRYTCALCRLDRVDTTLYGLSRSTYYDNACSRWYPAHVEPTHAHIWQRGTCRTLLNAMALPMGVGCRPDCPAIWHISPSDQIAIFDHFPNRQQAKELFRSLTDTQTASERISGSSQSKSELILKSLLQWQTAGFPGSWDDWWRRWWSECLADSNDANAGA